MAPVMPPKVSFTPHGASRPQHGNSGSPFEPGQMRGSRAAGTGPPPTRTPEVFAKPMGFGSSRCDSGSHRRTLGRPRGRFALLRSKNRRAGPRKLREERAPPDHGHNERERRSSNHVPPSHDNVLIGRFKLEASNPLLGDHHLVRARVVPQQCRKDYGRIRPLNPQRPTDVLTVHDHLTQQRQPRQRRRHTTADRRREPAQGVHTVTTELLAETIMHLLIEVEPRTNDASKPSRPRHRPADRHMRQYLSHRKPRAQRRQRPP